MKAVLISIQPKWCELIASGKKTVEVRKTKPNLETPFKVYIYCTQNTPYNPLIPMKYEKEGGNIYIGGKRYAEFLTSRVIGEFVCDKVVQFENDCYTPAFEETADLSCVGYKGLYDYLGAKQYGYGWHITDLVIYDKPKELSEFRSYNVSTYIDEEFGLPMPTHEIKRPPQSWCYVEEGADNEQRAD